MKQSLTKKCPLCNRPELQKLAQIKIRWYNLFQGKLSNKWLKQYNSTKLQSSTTAVTRPCELFVWWELKNKDIHGEDKNNKNKDDCCR